MVPEEFYTGGQLEKDETDLEILHVRRSKNGAWRMRIAVHVRMTLPDGREATTREEILNVPVRVSRKPLPDPFGWKAKQEQGAQAWELHDRVQSEVGKVRVPRVGRMPQQGETS